MNRKMNRWVDEPDKPPTAPRFTEKQGQYLAFIWAYRQLNGQSPAERDMQRHFRVTPPSVHQMVLTLERTWPRPKATGRGSKHRAARRSRDPTRPAHPSTRQILCAEVLVVALEE
jgi:hypothetical protein